MKHTKDGIKNTKGGFTIVETLVYVAIFAVAMVALVTVYRSSIETRSIALAQQSVLESRRVAEATILARLEESSGITVPASGTSTVLTVPSPTASQNPVTFALSAGRLTMKLGAAAAAPITGSNVTVTSFGVTRLDGVPASVTISIGYRTTSAGGTPVTSTSTLTFTERL